MSEETWDKLKCADAEIVISAFHTIITSMMIITVLIVIYQFVKHWKKEKSASMTKKCGLIFITSILMTLMCSILIFDGKCYRISFNLFQIADTMYLGMFALSSYILIIIFFFRINKVFGETPLCLSKYTKYTIYSFIIALPIYIIVALIVYTFCINCVHFILYLVVIFLLTYIGILISLVILFIYKLIQVYNNNTDNNALLSAITKMTILVSISVFVTFIHAIGNIFYFQFNDIYTKWITTAITMTDIYTNFICVIFCFGIFRNYYSIICKCCDTKCKICWLKLIVKENHTTIMLQIQNKPHHKEMTISSQCNTDKQTNVDNTTDKHNKK